MKYKVYVNKIRNCNKSRAHFAKEFSYFLEEVGVTKEASCLIVGLGNWNVTPDALGPIVVENVLVTRHLFQLQPESVEEGFRPVSAIRPGGNGDYRN